MAARFSVVAAVRSAKAVWQAAMQQMMAVRWAAMGLAVKSEMKKKAG